MHIDTAAARLHLALISPDDVPGVARALIRAGYDNSTMRGAATSSIGLDERLGLLAAGLSEAGVARMTDHEALYHHTWSICQAIHTGEMTPYDGARQLAGLRKRFPTYQPLIAFDGLVADWNATLTARPLVDQQISKLAILFLAGSA